MPSVTRNYVRKNDFKGQSVVLGLEDVRQKMLSLPTRLGVNVVRRGLVDGAGVIRDEARRLAPQPGTKGKRGYDRFGDLKKSIKAESRGVFKRGSGNVPTEHLAVVVIDKQKRKRGKSARSYARFVEYGTQPHAVGKGSILQVWDRSKAVKKQVGPMHPGSAPQPFMRPAFDGKKLEAVRAIAGTMRTELAKELAKMRSGSGS